MLHTIKLTDLCRCVIVFLSDTRITFHNINICTRQAFRSCPLTHPGRPHRIPAVKITAVIFDLDGTLTQPYLDFDLIRSEIGGVEGPLLESMEHMEADCRQRAFEILHRHELSAAANSRLNPGTGDLLDHLRRGNYQMGIITRNCRDSVDRVCRIHGLTFDCVVTREDGPAKPDPFAVLHACGTMNVTPDQAIVVGDYLFDLISARRAGSIGVLLTTQKNYAEFIDHADYVIDTLDELPGIIDRIETPSVPS